MTAGWCDAPFALRDLAEVISITTFRVWKNDIGNGGIKDFFKGGGGGNQRRGVNKYPLRTMFAAVHVFWS